MSLKTDVNEIKKFVESFGCKILSEYKSANLPLQISCKCGNIRKTNFTNFKYAKHKICKQCSVEERAKLRRFSFEYVKQFIENFNCKLLSNTYSDANTPLQIQCKCGEIWNCDFHTFKNSKHKACKICSALEGGKKLKGPNNPQYGKKGKLNPNFSNEKRNALAKKFRSPEYIEMREKVLHRDKCTCAKCNFIAKFKNDKGSLNIHHLFSKEQYPQWFYRISNLITLCGDCHKNFHKTFGYRNNKPSQMKIYLNR